MTVQPQQIEMNARELALYNAGEEIGHAKGLEESAAYLEKVVAEMRAYAGATLIRKWLEATAQGLDDQKRKPLAPSIVKRLAASLRQFASQSPGELQEGLAQLVERASLAVKARAGEHRGLFVQHLGRASQVDRSASLGTRIVKNIVRRL